MKKPQRPVTFGSNRVDNTDRPAQSSGSGLASASPVASSVRDVRAQASVQRIENPGNATVVRDRGQKSGVSAPPVVQSAEAAAAPSQSRSTFTSAARIPANTNVPQAAYQGSSQQGFAPRKGMSQPSVPYQPIPQDHALTVQHHVKPIRLETAYLDEPHHHRWLMTTCIAGVVASLLFGGVALGLFGHNAAPPEALASVAPAAPIERTNNPIATAAIPQTEAQVPAEAAEVKSPEVKSAEIIPERGLENEFSYPEITESQLPYDSASSAVALDSEVSAIDDTSDDNSTIIAKTPPAEPVDEQFRLTAGRSLKQELMNRGVTKSAADALIASINPVMPTKMIKPGTSFELTLDKQIDFYGREVIFPVELSFKPGPRETIVVEANEDGAFDARIEGKREGAKSQYAQVNQLRARARVGSSLYATAKDNAIPDYIVSEFTRVFSYDVDFQRQISATDSFELFFGAPLTGTSSKRKVLHYAELTYDGRTKAYFRFTNADGQTDYYDENGRSAARALLKTPISGARLTSGFGMRRHPLLGYSKMHTGADFGAPSGTPIRAAGSGTIDLAGRHGAYGNTIVVKHTTKHKTLYAHMSRFAAGIRAGQRVNQGQIIGYVGSTGRSTGPHLHYEVRVNDRPVNPTAIKAAGGKQLSGADLQRFRVNKVKVMAMMQQAPSATQVAQAAQQ
jgi:murein DD-endopeptidase MepM/ murein hydrolase activator NlpD